MNEQKNFTRVLRPGKVEVWTRTGKGLASLFVKVEYENGKLSLTGVESPRGDGNALGSCGQCRDSLLPLSLRELAPGWDRETVKTLKDIWERWHLNDMRPECAHQRAAGWIEKAKTLGRYVKYPALAGHPNSQVYDEKALGWLYPKEHPDGLLCRPCPTCGYEYGSKWLREEVPAEALAALQSMPETDITPAWV